MAFTKLPNIGLRIGIGDDEEYELWFAKLDYSALAMLKVHANMSPVELMTGVDKLDPDAVRALIWFARHLHGKPSDIRTVNFVLGEIMFEQIMPPAAVDPTTPRTSESGEPATSEPSASSSDSIPGTSTD